MNKIIDANNVNDHITVSKEFFDNSSLIRDDDECILPPEYFDKEIIKITNFLITERLNDSKILTKTMSLMHFLGTTSHIDFLIENLIPLLDKVTDYNFDEFIDEKFAANCNLVSLLWNKTKKKKIFFKLSKFNYALLSLDLSEDRSVTQQDLNNASDNLKCQIVILNAYDRNDITDVNMFYNLEELNVSSSGIFQIGIQQLTTLRKFNAEGNGNITNVNHMIQLEELNASEHSCGIDQKGIQEITTLRKLNVGCNKKITNINHMIRLEELDATGYDCGIIQKGIQEVTWLRRFSAKDNNEITDVNHMTMLNELDASGFCGITQEGIQQITTLSKFYAGYNYKITNVNHMTMLDELDASRCGINQEGIQRITRLRKLNVSYNTNITNVDYMIYLEVLIANGICGIGQKAIQNITWLRRFSARNNDKITDVNHMIKLEELDASDDDPRYYVMRILPLSCGIDQTGIQQITTLRKLIVYGNKKITNVNHMYRLEELYVNEKSVIKGENIKNLTSLRKLEKSFDYNNMTIIL